MDEVDKTGIVHELMRVTFYTRHTATEYYTVNLVCTAFIIFCYFIKQPYQFCTPKSAMITWVESTATRIKNSI